jgi:death-on-curing protein
VARRRSELVWLSRVVIDAIHHDQRREHGGLPGIRDENPLESASCGRSSSGTTTIRLMCTRRLQRTALAWSRTAPYTEGNKRTGFWRW